MLLPGDPIAPPSSEEKPLSPGRTIVPVHTREVTITSLQHHGEGEEFLLFSQPLGVTVTILRDNPGGAFPGIHHKKEPTARGKHFTLRQNLFSGKPKEPSGRGGVKKRLSYLKEYPGDLGVLLETLGELLSPLFSIESQKKTILRQKRTLLSGKIQRDPGLTRETRSHSGGRNRGSPGIRKKKPRSLSGRKVFAVTRSLLESQKGGSQNFTASEQ
jgi:hypothetical protein